MYIFEDAILPTHKKLKSIRKYLGVKQEDITGGKISRSLISYIENGKVKLTKPVAEVLSESFKEILDKKGLELDIDADYLMWDEIEQASFLLDKYLTRLEEVVNNISKDYIHEIEGIGKAIEKWDVPVKKSRIYELIGDFYYNIYQYSDSYIYYIKAYECYVRINNSHKTAKLISKVARCCICIESYMEAVNFNNYVLLILDRDNIEAPVLRKRCLFNNAIAYKKMGYYDRALEYLNTLEKLSRNVVYAEHVDISMLRGNCHIRMGELDKAEAIYKKLINTTKVKNDYERLSIAYINASLIYDKKGNIEKAIEYNKKALRIREQLNSKGLGDTLLLIAKRYMNLKEYDLSEKYLLRGLKEIDQNSELTLKISIYRELLKLYIFTNENYLVYKLIDEVIETYNQNQIVESKLIGETERFLLEGVSYLIERDSSKAKEVLNLIIRKGDKDED